MGHGAWISRIGLIALGLAVLASNTGCSPVHDKAHDLAGAFSGTYDSVVAAPSADVVKAAQGAVDDLHLILINETKESDQTTAIVIARSSSDEKVTVSIVPQSPDTTRFTVTTGVFGNSELRQQVMDAIKLRLGSAVIRPVSPTTLPTTTTVPNYTSKTVPY
jgi:hypothetical protein